MTDQHPRDGTQTFARLALGLAGIAMAVVVIIAVRPRRVEQTGPATAALEATADDGASADPTATAADVVTAAALAMGQVIGVEFTLTRSGAPVYIDAFESIALDDLFGQFSVPSRAQAEITVTIDDSYRTRLGAVAIDEEVWISNPVTGDFETLPPGYDIDPSSFFDPQDGWRPLLENLQDVRLVGIETVGGERYHIGGTAPAAQVKKITVGLVRDQDVAVDLWIHPTSYLVTQARFTTMINGRSSDWLLSLDRYDEPFTIRPPQHVRS